MKIEFENKVFKIRESIDIYLADYRGNVKIQFYKINTRERISIETNVDIAKFIANIDGVRSIKEIFTHLNISNPTSAATNLIRFLCQKNILIDNNELHSTPHHSDARFSRQTSFFEDWINVPNGTVVQSALEEKRVCIFGTGAVGSAIAILLARAGVNNFVLIDPKKISASSQTRHFFFRNQYLGMFKVDALADYILALNSAAKADLFYEKILPDTNLKPFVSGADIVINTADEPYIGHINLKIGRHLWPLDIAMYAAGGFDAHLMSTGEIIIPRETPCIDCYMNTFRKSLAGWKPNYPTPITYPHTQEKEMSQLSSGGLAQMSLFSASYASIQIIQYLIGMKISTEHLARRGECLFNHAKMTWFRMTPQGDCNVCS